MKTIRIVCAALLVGCGIGCCTTPAPQAILAVGPASGPTPWNAENAELLQWRAVDPHFGQDHALEGSGMAASQRYLYVVAEKYATLLQIDPQAAYRANALPLAVPEGAELEGVTWNGGSLLICDEAHAAVYEVAIDEEAIASGRERGPLPVIELPLVDLRVRGGKVGFEGIAVEPGTDQVYLLLERGGSPRCGCTATIYSLRLTGGELRLDGPPMVIALDDCNWRLSDIVLHDGRLLAMQSRYPGEEYRLLGIDPDTRRVQTLIELTTLGRSLRPRGFGNNLEGLAVGPDGWLYMVGDNADIPRALHELPPPTDEVTVFLRLPPALQ